jgi:hypothetical protein
VTRYSLLALGLTACGATNSPSGINPESAAKLELELHTVAEGPCAKLSVEGVGDRRFLVYGDTGYELADWSAGEKLPAAQSFVEITKKGPARNRALLEGLPRDARGYMPFSIELGSDTNGTPWLVSVDTRYAPRGTGALFDRSSQAYLYRQDQWREAPDNSSIGLGKGSLPDLSESEACAQSGLRFVALTHASSADGAVVIAGRCQDGSHINYSQTTLVAAHAKTTDSAWRYTRLPKTNRLDGIVNVALHAEGASNVWLTAFEPYAAIDGRPAYLAHFDGSQWREIDTDIDNGLMSVTGGPDGVLYLAGGRGLFRRHSDGKVERVKLPSLRFIREAPELHVRRVKRFPAGDLWVEASYRVRRATGEGGELSDVWASALFSNRAMPLPIYCDARETAFNALVEIEGTQ